jgi:opacity protein-like surface antigen
VKNKVLAFVCAVAMLAGPVQAQDAEVPVSDDFEGVGYSIDDRSEVYVAVALRNVGGRAAVCGVIWIENGTGTGRRLEPRFSQRILRFSVAGQVLRVNVREFNRFGSEGEAAAGQAGCSTTNVAWQDGFASRPLEVDLSPVTLRD